MLTTELLSEIDPLNKLVKNWERRALVAEALAGLIIRAVRFFTGNPKC